jgi:hypothetical protein
LHRVALTTGGGGRVRRCDADVRDRDEVPSGIERQAMRQIGEPVREALRDRFDIPLQLLLLSPEEV